MTATQAVQVPSGIVSWWPANGNADDIISGYNGTPVGNVTYGPGKVGRGFTFDGKGSGMQVTAISPGLQLQNFTIESWIQRASTSTVSYGTGGNGVIMSYAPGGYCFFVNSIGQLVLSQLGDYNWAGGQYINDTNWHHVAVTVANGTVIFYLDGVASTPQAYNVTYTFTGGPGIGYRPDNDDNSFYGSIDELSVYSRALAPNEIAAIYQAGSFGKCYCYTPVIPTITSQPTNETVYVGQTASFTVSATGASPLSYQWMFEGTNILGATNAMLTLTDIQLLQAGDYAVLVSAAGDSVISSNAVLTVNSPPACDPSPSGLVSWWAGEDNMTDEVSGYNGTAVGNLAYGPGEAGQCFVFDGNGSGVQVTNDSPGLQSQNFTIESWVQRASTSTVSYGTGGNGVIISYSPGGYCFFVNSIGQLVLSQLGDYNWVGGQYINDTSWHHVAVTVTNGTVIFYLDGVASAPSTYDVTYTFTGGPGIGYRPDNDDNSFYGSIDELSVYNRALASNEIAAIYLAGSGGKCHVPMPPTITQQPRNEIVSLGQTAHFTVAATSIFPLKYQWTFRATNIAGATNSSLTLTNVKFANDGLYAAVVSTPYASTDSSHALLSVRDVLGYFRWTPISSPRFVHTPFRVTIRAMGTTNELFTNFNGTVSIISANGIAIKPSLPANFEQGVWTGSLIISQPANNLVLLATNAAGPVGLANTIAVFNQPSLRYNFSGNLMQIHWPVMPTNFMLEASPDLINWTPVGIPPLQIGDENIESIPITTGTNLYYRLGLGGN
ncbi:MAG TPA: LamG-like jellyroll fold domain-containing protein [Verrucomicrobiae bacterium]